MATSERTPAAIKADLLALAESFQGQGDPDFAKQKQLQPLVDELLAASPQPPLSERIELLRGTWQQVWGPYDYRNDDRGVDPQLANPAEIYQVVFPDGYYYNVAPLQKPGKALRIGLLRGKYKLLDDQPDTLRVRFTKYPGVEGRPEATPLWELPPQAEAGTLENKTTIVPGWIVYLFFGGGYLREVYTDDTLRLTYGSENLDDPMPELYVLRRVVE